MKTKTLATALLLGMLLFAVPTGAAEEPSQAGETDPTCPPVFITTYDPYVTVYWHCIPDLPLP